MKAEQVKVGMVVYDSVGRAYVRVVKSNEGDGLFGVSLGNRNAKLWMRVPAKNLRPLTRKEKGL